MGGMTEREALEVIKVIAEESHDDVVVGATCSCSALHRIAEIAERALRDDG